MGPNPRLDGYQVVEATTCRGAISLVAAGPSVRMAEFKRPIACINHSHDFLVERGITPDYCFIYERKPLYAIKRRVGGCRYLTRAELTLADCELLGPGCAALSIAWGLGYRAFDLYGFDMCHADTTHVDGTHAYAFINEVICDFKGATYRTSHRLLYHLRALADLIERGFAITVHGDSLMAAVAYDLAKGGKEYTLLPDSLAFARAKEKWHGSI